MLKVQKLGKTFVRGNRKYHVFSGVNFTVEAGEIVLLTGKSGCGKSVLLSLLSGMDRVSEGKIELDGEDLAEASASRLSTLRATDLGIVFQNHNLIDSWTVMENVLSRASRHIVTAKKMELAEGLLEKFGMYQKSDNFPGELSMGQKMLVTIARSLMVKPKLLLADEPTGELDRENARIVVDCFREMAINDGIGILVASHGYFDEKDCNRVLRLEDGLLH